MASHDLSVFLEEFGATVNLTLPGIVSEKERLLLKLLMEGMSVTEISQYRNRSAKTISHQKKQLYEKLGIQSDITFWRDIFFQYHPQVISGTGNKNNFYIPDNRCHHIVTPEDQSGVGKPRIQTVDPTGFLSADWGTDGL